MVKDIYVIVLQDTSTCYGYFDSPAEAFRWYRNNLIGQYKILKVISSKDFTNNKSNEIKNEVE